MNEIINIEEMNFYLVVPNGYVISFDEETMTLKTTTTNIEKAMKYKLIDALDIAFKLQTRKYVKKIIRIEPTFEELY